MRLPAGRLLIVWPLLVSVAVVTPAVFLNKTTEVDIQLLLSRVSFRVKEPLQTGLFGSVVARSVTAVSFGTIDLGSGRFEGFPVTGGAPAADTGAGDAVRITASDPLARVTLDDVTVQEMRVPVGSVITMEWEGPDQANEGQALSLKADALAARFAPIPGKLLSIRACVGCLLASLPSTTTLDGSILSGPARFVASTDQLMSLSSAPAPGGRGRGLGMTMRLELGAGGTLAETVIPVPEGVDMTIPEGTKRVSAVVEGAIRYPGYTLAPRELRQGDFVVLGDMPDLRILSLQIDKGIRVRLHGHAAHVSTGPPGFVTDTVPSWFQWYMSSLFPYVHATIALAAAALAAFQKLKSAPSGERPA